MQIHFATEVKFRGKSSPKFLLPRRSLQDKPFVLQQSINEKCDIMKLDELPFEIFERVVQNVSFVDLPYLLQVSRSVHVPLPLKPENWSILLTSLVDSFRRHAISCVPPIHL
jgi:hypothetical protein